MQMTVRIERFNPETDEEPYWAAYDVPAEPTSSVLDLLNHIKWHRDGSLAFRKSCGHGVCGSDAMQINGENRLACQQLVQDLIDGEEGKITVKSLPAFPIIKDLVVDQNRFFEKYRAVKPWLITDAPTPPRERLQTPEEHARIEDSGKCIMCGACTSSCPSMWADPDYIGPAAFMKAHRYEFDTRDDATEERLKVLDSKDGLWKCYTIFNCVEACPKNIQITRWIEALKRKAVTERH